jgi:hypothetical protein
VCHDGEWIKHGRLKCRDFYFIFVGYSTSNYISSTANNIRYFAQDRKKTLAEQIQNPPKKTGNVSINVTLRGVRVTTVAGKINYYHMF